MILARVIGHVWSTRKEESLRGLKFLVVQPVTLTYTEDGTAKLTKHGNSLITADQIGAGESEIVMIASGSSARQGLANRNTPIDAIIVGIIDKETFEA
ncbi:EutN/CcmL family microcompartment protein [Desulfosporosinus sp. BICA1-9]|uniref:EutN/CcmL family microcompartment protein n=1 Tax=Desulfosporosinus sp. BICA1-9 TaxID=1531958 RepID=UPI00054BACF8|nr:EutN/CcmL family microcompartment protein [Desulfosporosinus sp. BICA1-9]KJS49290.1 MAG: ethanolamine utilization protein EutN [Peptococcaceae bacterium BRH_c23]KJS81199.1 MAG: ethanolamine utilization protein EutN [Desulfosporosinus sp. BICA1-9]HBW37530.1 ethanolamine utilization protein EutN [Desulfosporosinus sp.]